MFIFSANLWIISQNIPWNIATRINSIHLSIRQSMHFRLYKCSIITDLNGILFTGKLESGNGCSLKNVANGASENSVRYRSLQLTWRHLIAPLFHYSSPFTGASVPTFQPLKVIGPAFTVFIAPTQFELNYFYGGANCYFVALSRLSRRN